MRRGVQAHVGNVSAIQLREERTKPVGVLVVDGDGLHGKSGFWGWRSYVHAKITGEHRRKFLARPPCAATTLA